MLYINYNLVHKLRIYISFPQTFVSTKLYIYKSTKFDALENYVTTVTKFILVNILSGEQQYLSKNIPLIKSDQIFNYKQNFIEI